MTECVSGRNGLLDVICGYLVAGDRRVSAFGTDAELVLPARSGPSQGFVRKSGSRTLAVSQRLS